MVEEGSAPMLPAVLVAAVMLLVPPCMDQNSYVAAAILGIAVKTAKLNVI